MIAQRVMERLLSAIDQYTQQETLPLVPNTASDTLLAQCQATLDQSMQLPAKEAQRLERRLGEAMLARKLLAVVHCFTLVHNQYRLYEHAAPYEQLSNDARAERLTLQQLALDMPRHEWHYREVLQLAHYLAQRRPALAYTVYRRPIVLLDDGAPLHSKTPWYHSLFQPHRAGHYYALSVNFGLSAHPSGEHCESV